MISVSLKKTTWLWIGCCSLWLAGCTPRSVFRGTELPERDNIHLRYESEPLNDFLIYRGFVVRYDTLHRVPRYTVHRLSPAQLNDSLGYRAERSDRFWADPRINAYSSGPKDYYRSGYDRGHHVPAGDFVYSQADQDDSFTYSNISPQNPKLNRYALASLEKTLRERVLSCQCEAYVVTGTLYETDTTTIGTGQVAVPTHLYKLAYFPKEQKMFAFLFNNHYTWYNRNISLYQVSVNYVEALAEKDFFDRLPDEMEEAMERKTPAL
ncbi:MAG: DNA/RNA non-specific endonuclease [Leptolyngbya sp. SIO3F4]|nr:DNA/RNA non-specific endonuclease [Leptolyngbya sp. SIO3F4]